MKVDVLLVGGGVAAASCAGELREQGFDGSVLLAGRELDPPYQRPPITKGLLTGTGSREDAQLTIPEDVEVRTRTSVMRLDLEAREATLSTKDVVTFDKALVATGANVRRLPVDGTDLEGIHYLRALRNADALRADVDGVERVALVGGSFIACEVAASLTTMGIACTLVFPEDEPMSTQFGATAGRAVRRLLEAKGIEVASGEQVTAFAGDGEDVQRVVCASGRSIECQAAVIGIGAVPDVMLARASKLALGALGGVACSATLETSAPGVFAAGDMCEYESVVHGRTVRIEHHEVAAAQGRHAARAMLGAAEPYAEVPYFWSDLADWATIESVGPAVDGWDDEEVRGTPDDGAFAILYRRGGRVVQAMTCGPGHAVDLAEARELIRAG